MDRAQNPNLQILMLAFVDAVFGHMPTDETSQARVLMILKTIREIASLKNE